MTTGAENDVGKRPSGDHVDDDAPKMTLEVEATDVLVPCPRLMGDTTTPRTSIGTKLKSKCGGR